MPRLSLLTQELRRRLLDNGRRGRLDPAYDPVPVLKLFTPDAQATWLLTELNPDAPDIAFGLCDLGLGSPELGSVSLAEIAQLRGRFGLTVERDRHFQTCDPLSVHVHRAQATGRVVA